MKHTIHKHKTYYSQAPAVPHLLWIETEPRKTDHGGAGHAAMCISCTFQCARLCSRAGMQQWRGEVLSLPFGGDIWEVGKRDVQGVLLVAKYKAGQREAEGKSWVAIGPLLRSLDGVLWATAALGRCGDPCEEGLKPGGRESRKMSLSLGDLPPSRASLAIWIHFWDDYLPSCTHQIGNHSQKAVTGNYAAWEWRVMPKYASDKCDGVFRKKEGKREK